MERAIWLAVRYSDEPGLVLPDLSSAQQADVDEALVFVDQFMVLCPKGVIGNMLDAIAKRFGVRDYTVQQRDLDAELLDDLPHDLCREALRRTWGNWDKPWMPSVKFIRQQVEHELAERRHVRGALLELRLKLSTIARQQAWDEENRQRHAQQKEREWAALREAVDRRKSES